MNPVAEKVLVGVVGGIITAGILAVAPNMFRWLVRPAVPSRAVVAFDGACPRWLGSIPNCRRAIHRWSWGAS